MHISYRIAFAALLFGVRADCQQLEIPNSRALEWPNVRVVVSPIANKVFVWTGPAPDYKPSEALRNFEGFFDPAETLAWTSEVRWLLDQKLTASDTSSSYTSATLEGERGTIYVVRLKQDGDWSRERFLVLNSGFGKPLILRTTDLSLRDILDSFDATARRVPSGATQSDAVRDLIALFHGVPERPARPKRGSQPPPYPEKELWSMREGLVLLSFVVDENGKPDMSTAEVFHATSREFLTAVLSNLPKMRFDAAESRGRRVRQRVLMPFAFLFRR
jgi:hypothetical protein